MYRCGFLPSLRHMSTMLVTGIKTNIANADSLLGSEAIESALKLARQYHIEKSPSEVCTARRGNRIMDKTDGTRSRSAHIS